MVSPKTDSVNIRINAQPLIAVLYDRGLLGDISSPTVRKWRETGIDIYWADKWAVKLGMHPIEIFGMQFYANEE
jgi:hypothetical protein